MKKRHILALSLPILAAATLLILVIIIIAAVVLFKPFEKPQNVVYGGAFDPRTCIGEGCHYASSDRYGGVYCDGYSCDLGNLTFICYNTLDEYCRGCRPQEDPKACACTYNNVSARYCTLNESCYSNQAEYQVGCVTDVVRGCAEMEQRILNASPADYEYGCNDAIVSIRGLQSGECANKTWNDIYDAANDSVRLQIFSRASLLNWFEPPKPTFETACKALCTKCESSLCQPGKICEHAQSS